LQPADAHFRFVVANRKAQFRSRRNAMTEQNGSTNQTPIESWKEIAAYLKRDVRTVKRWEKSEGLPVHRYLHQARSSVYAYPSELDAWKVDREPRLNAPPLITPWRRATAAVGFALTVLLSLATLASGPILTPSSAAAEDTPKFTKIRIPTKLSSLGVGALSPDGGRFAFASEGSIWVVPVHGKVDPGIAGEPRKLTEAMPGWVVLPTWSGDGKWIAFNQIDEDHGSIYVVPSEGGQTKKIPLKTYGSGYLHNHRLSLSPDGKLLAFASTQEQEKGKREALRIYTVPVEGGAATRLTDSWSREPAFSPDGAKLAYVKVRELGPREERTEVWVMPVEGGTAVLVADVPNRPANPVWSPDGKMIAYLTTSHSGSKELWIVPVSERGGPVAAPTKIGLPNAAYDLPAGWTSEDKIALFFPSPEYWAIYTVPASGGKATQVTPSGIPSHPRWSPDGKRIYLRWGLGDLASVSAGGGEPSLIPVRSDPRVIEATPGGGNAISPDGKKIVFSGGHRGLEGVPIWTIPVGGGEPTRLTTPPTDNRFPCWSPDGNTIAFVSYRKNEENTFLSNIYTIPAVGGEVRQLTSESDGVAWSTIAWSPDGRLLAYFSKETIKVIPATGGESRDVVNIGPTKNPHSGLAWSPDNKRLAYTSEGRIWTASLDGGAPTQVKTGLDARAFHMAWSPDGEKLAFSAAKGGWEEPELWLMEDFLPRLEAAR
jgi:Tol biopolymer transport system component